MAARRLLPIETVPLVGGALCLNFLNTTGRRVLRPTRERLRDYHDLMVFCSRTGLLDRARRGALARRSEKDPRAAKAALDHLIEMREVLYRLFVAAVRRDAPADADVVRFNNELARVSSRRRLVWARGAPGWVWAPEPGDLEQMLGPILFSASELLGSPDLASVKQCGACVWMFLDTTRNHSRHWCKKTCGDRVKSRRYYLRHKARRKRGRSPKADNASLRAEGARS